MAYTLTLLGTDTKFAPDTVPGEYDRAETLSYVSTLIDGADSIKVDDVTQYQNQKVTVVDGPTTFGAEVGDRIARGVLAILEAISRGETDINIIAHSRGAVEGILVAHELERIQGLLLSGEHSLQSIMASCCEKYTRKAMTSEPHTSSFQKLELEAISQKIGDVKISMFNMDPVPGGNFLGITALTSLPWQDGRFYTVPKIVKEYEQYTYENERTRCFKGIIPKAASSDTVFKIHSLPGHHGTGSGNLLDQQRGKNPVDGTTQHVQELVMVKLIEFLIRNKTAIARKKEVKDPFSTLMDKLFGPLDGIGQKSPSPKTLQHIYLELYDEILKNKAVYEYYNQTSYPILGQENGFFKLFWTVEEERIVHYQAHNDTLLKVVVPPVAERNFLNYEHARLKINQELGLSSETLSETVKQASARLIEVCRRAQSWKDLTSKASKDKKPSEAMSLSTTTDGLAKAVTSSDGYQLLRESLGVLIEGVREAYLQGRIAEGEREALYSAVQGAFDSFKEFTRNNPHNELAQETLDTFNSHLATMLDTKCKTLAEHCDSIRKMKNKTFFANLIPQVEQIKGNLDGTIGAQTLNELLDSFISETKELIATHPTIETLKLFIINKANLFSPKETELVTIKNYKDNLVLLMQEALDTCTNYDANNVMQEVMATYEGLSGFLMELPNFKVFNNQFDYESLANNLEKNKEHLVFMAAEYIAKEQLDLDVVIKPLLRANPDLYEQIETVVLGVGSVNPLLKVLDLEKNALKSEIEKMKAALQMARVQYEEHSAKSNAVIKEKEHEVEALKLVKTEKEHEVEALKTAKAEKEHEVEALKLAKTEKEHEVEALKTAKAEKEHEVEALKTVKAEKEHEVEALKTAKAEKEHEVEALKTVKAEKEHEVEALKTVKAEKEHEVEALKTAKAEKEHEVEALKTAKAEKEREIEVLKTAKVDKEREVEVLKTATADKESLKKANEDLRKQKENLESVLNSETEFKCQKVIYSKLLPLTRNYLVHLAKEIDPKIKTADTSKLISTLQVATIGSEKLKNKFDIVSQLYFILTAKTEVLIPSAKIKKFAEQLSAADNDIKIHRDAAWKRYTANVFKVLSIIASGVLPGLFVLWAVSKSQDKSLKFWESSGQTFFNASKGIADIPQAPIAEQTM